MNITTKFVENDTVYFLLNGKIQVAAVTQFNIRGTTPLAYHVSYTIKYYPSGGLAISPTTQTISESSVFVSPQDLTKDLIQEFKNSNQVKV